MTKREFLNTVFRLAPNKANAIMDAFDEYVDSNEPHWTPVTEGLPEKFKNVLVTSRGGVSMAWYNGIYFEKGASTKHRAMQTVKAWMPLPEPYKESEVTT